MLTIKIRTVATLFFSISILFSNVLLAQNAGISYDGAAPNKSAAFDINVSSLFPVKKGLLIPTLTLDERLAMNPLPESAPGLLVYQSNGGVPGFYYNASSNLTPDWKLMANDQSVRWDALQDPTSHLLINNGAFATNFTFNGATELSPFRMSSNSLTKGNLLELSVSTIDGASGFSTAAINVLKSGANINQNHTSYGISSRVSNTGTLSNNVAGYFRSVGGTNNFALLVPPDGGKVSFGSLISATNAMLSITNGHFQAQQTTRPTIATTLNAGILSDGTLDTYSSDVAGTFNINSTASTNFGEQATITFNKTFTKPPTVVVTAANVYGATRSFWVTSSTSSFKIFFTSSPAQATTYSFNYMVIEN